MGLLAWLKKITGADSFESALPVPTRFEYLAADRSVCATKDGAAYRVEEYHQIDLVAREVYNLLEEPEWLEETTEVGTDAQGQPLHRRTWYYPCGQLRKQIMRCGEVLSYQTYFESGDLHLSKRAEAGRLTERFAYAPERGSTYLYVEKMPQYPGGDMQQLVGAIQKAFKYPAQALRNREEGRLILGFTVTRTGRLAHVEVKQSVSPSIDEAGIRAVVSIGTRRWQPGFQNRRAVDVSFTVPITCKVQ